MISRNFLDFDIQIIRAEKGYLAIMKAPDGRSTQINFSLPFLQQGIKQYLSELVRRGAARGLGSEVTTASPEMSQMRIAKSLGGELFQAVFREEGRARLDQVLDQISDEEKPGVRLRFDLSGAPDLVSLPWEYLFYPERNFFIALEPGLTVVRTFQTPQAVSAMKVTPPLRILAMACSPKDQVKLDVALERQRLEQSLAELTQAQMVKIDWLETNSLGTIEEKLKDTRYHIFHFIGHGEFYEAYGERQGVLIFEDSAHMSSPVTAERLAMTLRRAVKLAVINACEGALGDPHDPSIGISTSLLQQGIPAVVAMQFKISDDVAIQFAGDFYRNLAIGLPVDAAVTGARRSVFTHFNNNVEWATPVLYMRSPDGKIFQIERPAATDSNTKRLQTQQIQKAVESVGPETPITVTEVKTDTTDVFKQLPEWAKELYEIARGQGIDETRGRLDQASLQELYRKARTLMSEKKWGEATRVFKEINAYQPGYSDVAILLRQSEQAEQAILLQDLYNRAIDRMRAQKWDEAARLLTEYNQLSPGNTEIARLLTHSKKQQEAKQLQDLYEAAVTAIKSEKWGEAIRSFREINKRSPGYLNVADLWSYSEQQEELFNWYKSLNDNYGNRNWKKALDLAIKILQKDPGYKDTRRLYDLAYRQLYGVPPVIQQAPSPPPGAGVARPPQTPPPGHFAPRPSQPPVDQGGSKPAPPPPSGGAAKPSLTPDAAIKPAPPGTPPAPKPDKPPGSPE